MQLIAVVLISFLSLPTMASTYFECDLQVKVEKNFGLIQAGSKYLQINVPMTVLVEKNNSTEHCIEKVGYSFTVQLAVPLQILTPVQINLKEESTLNVQYTYSAPRGGAVSEEWLLTKAPY